MKKVFYVYLLIVSTFFITILVINSNNKDETYQLEGFYYYINNEYVSYKKMKIDLFFNKENISFREIEKSLLNLNAYEFTLFATLIGFLICDGLNYNEQQSLGNFFEMLGQTALTIGAQNQNLDNFDVDNQNNYDSLILLLKNKIDNIDNIVAEIKNMKL